MKRLALPLVVALLLLPSRLLAEGCYIDPITQQEICPPPATACFDPNGDGEVDAADFFYLVNYFYRGGPPPVGPADANGDGDVDPADLFYLYAYLFEGGPAPHCL